MPFFEPTRRILNGAEAPLDTGDRGLLNEDLDYVFSFEDCLFIPNNIFKKGDIFFKTPTVIEYLANFAKSQNLQLKLYFVFRVEREWLESYYLQTLQKGQHWSFSEFSERSEFKSVNWMRLLQMIRAEGVEVCIFNFDNIKKGQEFFLHDFFSHFLNIKIADQLKIPERRFNTSISGHVIEILKTGNKNLSSDLERQKLRRFLQENFPADRYGKAKFDWSNLSRPENSCFEDLLEITKTPQSMDTS